MLKKLLLLISMCTHCVTAYYFHADLSMCCSQTSSTQCMNKCKKINGARNLNDVTKMMPDLLKSCPRSEDQFWSCVKSSQFMIDFRKQTEQELLHNTRIHTPCCKDAIHPACEIKCLTTQNVTELQHTENCDNVREPEFAACIHKAQASQTCCMNTANIECQQACTEYFKKSAITSIGRHKAKLARKCGKESWEMKCVLDKSDSGLDFTKCCSMQTSPRCAEKCREVAHGSIDQIFVSLSPYCGQFRISEKGTSQGVDVKNQTPVYKCMLDTSTSVPAPVDPPIRPVDVPVIKNVNRQRTVSTNFKYPCCARAKSQNCKRWCMNTIATTFQPGLWDDNYLACIQNPDEHELSSCMTSMMEPCKIGGKREELRFCSNLNNRPLELFRRFNRFGDSSAQKLMKFWSNGTVKVLQYRFHFKNLRQCHPDKFKALACLLAVEPCSHNIPMLQVCRVDCENLLDECLDSSRSSKESTPQRICSLLLPSTNQTTCLKLNDYVTKPKEIVNDKVTLPCESNPCGHGEVCILNQSYDRYKIASKPYICVRGCPVGEKSSLIIPARQLAKLVVSNKHRECHKVCECQVEVPLTTDPPITIFADCKQFGCHRKRNCSKNNKEYRDGEVFIHNCNTCTCYDGKLICSQKNCDGENQERSVDLALNVERTKRHHTGELEIKAPCNCHALYSPVCGANGMTYPNTCLAKCWHYEDYQINVGDCQAVDPCHPNPCSSGHQCIPRRCVCLSTNTHCPQFTCHVHDPTGYFKLAKVCDRDEVSPVCGYDGVTYNNECLANQSGTGVDYDGPCLPSHFDKPKGNINRCSRMKHKCKPIKESNCELFIPPGSCCPVCGSMLRVLYNERDLRTHQNFVSYYPITMVDVLKTMRQLQEVAECKLFGHLTVEQDIMFLMIVDTEQPSRAQVHACNNEAKKIQNYINKRSPMVGTPYYLSILKASTLETAYWTAKKESSGHTLHNNNSLFLSTSLCIIISLVFLYR